MKLVSTTLTGNNADLIGDALKSVVKWVDRCLVIDTGVTDGSLEIAREVAKDKCVVRRFAWVEDFAAARNFALDEAHAIGGDWCITLDTDERIRPNGENVKGVLGAATAPVMMMTHDSGSYAKERCFKLPATARFQGPTHEFYPAHEVGYATFGRARFEEVTKSKEQLRRKFERDVRVLTAHTQKEPRDPRWHYYLGDALALLERHEEAIASFEACAALRGWDEESAWACYRAAECWCRLEQWQKAVDACAAGLARHAGIAELAWLAGFASWKAARMEQAVWWSRLSIAMGRFRGSGGAVRRIGFRHPSALYEGPYDVLRFALRALGDKAGADEAEALYQQATVARLASV